MWGPLPALFSPIYTWRKAGLVAVIVWPNQSPNLDWATLDNTGGGRKSRILLAAKIRQSVLLHNEAPHETVCQHYLTAKPNTVGYGNDSMCDQKRETGGWAGRWQSSLQEASDFKSWSLLRDTSLCLMLFFCLVHNKDGSRLQNPKHDLLFSTAVWVFHKRNNLVVFV